MPIHNLRSLCTRQFQKEYFQVLSLYKHSLSHADTSRLNKFVQHRIWLYFNWTFSLFSNGWTSLLLLWNSWQKRFFIWFGRHNLRKPRRDALLFKVGYVQFWFFTNVPFRLSFIFSSILMRSIDRCGCFCKAWLYRMHLCPIL